MTVPSSIAALIFANGGNLRVRSSQFTVSELQVLAANALQHGRCLHVVIDSLMAPLEMTSIVASGLDKVTIDFAG
jgi:hypothetical protein